jgi:hypothetical protein
MVHQSLRNVSRVADELYIKRVFLALEDFVFFSLYSFSCIAKQVTTSKQLQHLSCLNFLNPNFERLSFCFDIPLKLSISPVSNPARYTFENHKSSQTTLEFNFTHLAGSNHSAIQGAPQLRCTVHEFCVTVFVTPAQMGDLVDDIESRFN